MTWARAFGKGSGQQTRPRRKCLRPVRPVRGSRKEDLHRIPSVFGGAKCVEFC